MPIAGSLNQKRTGTQALSAYQLLHDCHQLSEALLGIARLDRVLNAAAGVVLKQLHRHRVERGLHRADLR